MTQPLYTLNAEDIQLLQGLLDRERSRVRNTQGRTLGEQEPRPGNGGFLALVPDGGIPARSGTTVEAAECEIYRRVDDVVEAAGFTREVYNPSSNDIPAGSYVLVRQDQWGTFWTQLGDFGYHLGKTVTAITAGSETTAGNGLAVYYTLDDDGVLESVADPVVVYNVCDEIAAGWWVDIHREPYSNKDIATPRCDAVGGLTGTGTYNTCGPCGESYCIYYEGATVPSECSGVWVDFSEQLTLVKTIDDGVDCLWTARTTLYGPFTARPDGALVALRFSQSGGLWTVYLYYFDAGGMIAAYRVLDTAWDCNEPLELTKTFQSNDACADVWPATALLGAFGCEETKWYCLQAPVLPPGADCAGALEVALNVTTSATSDDTGAEQWFKMLAADAVLHRITLTKAAGKFLRLRVFSTSTGCPGLFLEQTIPSTGPTCDSFNWFGAGDDMYIVLDQASEEFSYDLLVEEGFC